MTADRRPTPNWPDSRLPRPGAQGKVSPGKGKGKLTQARLKELLEATGGWTRRLAARGRARAGTEAGCTRSDGYRYIRIDGRIYLLSRLAVL